MAYPGCEGCGNCADCNAPLTSITPALSALGFTIIPNQPVPCALKFDIADADCADIITEPTVPSWIKCAIGYDISTDNLCDDATDPPTPFVRTTVVTCGGTRTVIDSTPDGLPYTVAGNVVCCGGAGGAVPDVVTTLIEDAIAKTATYTNEIGATTVLSETDFTANSQVIPATCEGVLADADVKRELPVRWHAASKTYKAYDDGRNTAISFQSPWNGTYKPMGTGNTPTGYAWSTPVSVVVVNNPSACRPMLLTMSLIKDMLLDSTDGGTVVKVVYRGYVDSGSGLYLFASLNLLSSQVNVTGQIHETALSFLFQMPTNVIPAGGSLTLRSYQDAEYVAGNSPGAISNSAHGFGQIQGIGVIQ